MVVSTRVRPVTVSVCIVLCLMAASVHSGCNGDLERKVCRSSCVKQQQLANEAVNDRIDNQDAILQTIATDLSVAQIATQDQNASLQNITSDLTAAQIAIQEQVASLQAALDRIKYLEILVVPWLERSCDSDDDCPDDINAECFKGKCLCTPGYYYSNGQAVCVEDCPVADLQDEVLVYPDSAVLKNTLQLIPSSSLDDCKKACAARSNPRCLTFYINYGHDCYLIKTTPLQAGEDFIRDFSPITILYQPRCA